MSQKSGLKAPNKIGRPTGLPTQKSAVPGSQANKAQNAIAKSARAAGLPAGVAESYAADLLKRTTGPEPQANMAAATDDYKIGDRVFVGGTKAGSIAFIGETQFAPGDWVGVVLDQLVGKNDGSVAGVRYFQCEAKRGVFSRLTKLSKTFVEGGMQAPAPGSAAVGDERESSASGTPSPTQGSAGVVPAATPPAATPPAATPPAATPAKPKTTAAATAGVVKTAPSSGRVSMGVSATPKPSGLIRKSSVGGSQSNLTRSSPSGSMSNLLAGPGGHPLRPGDRVVVSGSKVGVLRYVGTAEFAKGDWVGVELDEPMGKNDGSVAGKRYFDCRPMHGLFAPVHKVVRSMAPAPSPGGLATPARRSSVGKLGPALGLSSLSRREAGSQDSISSIGSACSSASRTRAPKTSARPSPHTLSATTSALQKAMKEKEEHIEQLLRERDMERSELVKAAAMIEEAESEMAAMRAEHERVIEELESTQMELTDSLERVQREKQQIYNHLEEEKRKVEDLQFAVEEETINKSDLESQSEVEQAQMKVTQDKLQAEVDRGDRLQRQLDALKADLEGEQSKRVAATTSSDQYIERIEELTHKLSQAEKKIQSFEEEKHAEASKGDQTAVLLRERTTRLTELEATCTDRDRDVKGLQLKLAELEEELKETQAKSNKQLETIDGLMSKLASSDTASSNLVTDIHQLKSQVSDLQRQLNASEEKAVSLEDDRTKLGQQITELMAHSGDSSEQLSLMNRQLIEKDRKVAELQAALSDSTQRIGKLSETIEGERERVEREGVMMMAKHEQDLEAAQQQLQEAHAELEKATTRLTSARQTHDQEKQQLLADTQAKIAQLKDKLAKVEGEAEGQRQEVKGLKETLQQVQTEKDNMNFEKEKLEKTVKKLEAEKGALSDEKAQVVSERDGLVAAKEAVLAQHGSSAERITQLMAEKNTVVKEKSQLVSAMEVLESSQKILMEERDALQREMSQTHGTIQERDQQIQTLVQQVAALQAEGTAQTDLVAALEELTQDKEKAVAEVTQQLAASQAASQALDGRLKILEMERDALKMQVTTLKGVQREKQELESQQATLRAQVEDLQQSHMKDSLEGERLSLKKAVESAQTQLKTQQTDMDTLHGQISALESHNSSLRKQADATQNLEREKRLLEQRISELEGAVAQSRTNANLEPKLSTGEPAPPTPKEEQDSQIDFLNTVIVDLQRRNDELKLRLVAMETGAVNGTGSDLGLDLSGSDSPAKLVAPRLFCDICEVFDLHDTDDCPKQMMDDSPPASLHHGVRAEERPYCDICEVFGHWTSSCDDEQTF